MLRHYIGKNRAKRPRPTWITMDWYDGCFLRDGNQLCRSTTMQDIEAGNTGDGGQTGAIGAGERMRRAVAAAVAGQGSTKELQAASRDLVKELRKRNDSPEQVLLQIKQFLA